MKKLLRPAFITTITTILVGSVSCSHNGVGPSKPIPHFPVIYRFEDVNDSTILTFHIHAGVYFPKEDSTSYEYNGEANAVVGYVLEDSITAADGAITEPYPGCKAAMMIIAKKFWHGNTGHNIPTWRAWYLKPRVIYDPDSNVISFKWPDDTLSPNVEYIGYVNQ